MGKRGPGFAANFYEHKLIKCAPVFWAYTTKRGVYIWQER
jgi:hypothetical protein